MSDYTGEVISWNSQAETARFILSKAEADMLRVREAVQRAKSYLPDVFESAAAQEMLLEGVELTDDEKFWSVTFSYPAEKSGAGLIGRDYKTVRLRAEDGQFFGARNGFLISDL